ncbi:MAG: hypothetical protein ACRER5_14595, partial [Pseudomonas sp.]
QSLLAAVSQSDVERTHALLRSGISPNDFPPDLTGPLHLAVRMDDCRLVEMLLFAGADPDRMDGSGRSALDYAHGA